MYCIMQFIRSVFLGSAGPGGTERGGSGEVSRRAASWEAASGRFDLDATGVSAWQVLDRELAAHNAEVFSQRLDDVDTTQVVTVTKSHRAVAGVEPER